jgi:putative (di)nucleoside polyphosphate hydrolase
MFLLVQLKNWPKNFWKFPQGGIKQGETEKQAVIRELTEELGTSKFKIVAKSPYTHKYDWGRDSVEKAGFRWRGQKQRFYLVEFLGENKDIKINTKEIQNYRWVRRSELARHFHHKHKLFANYNLVIQKNP